MSRGSKILVNGVNLYYERVGKGDHVLLFMPGVLGCIKTDFEPNLKLLNRDKFSAVGFDPRGYGNSRPPDRDFPPNYLTRDADDGAALMEALGFASYSLVGWSSGSMSACILAAKFSDRVRKLFVWGGRSYLTREDLITILKHRDLASLSDGMKQPMLNIYGKEYFEKTWHAFCDHHMRFEEYGDKHGRIDLFIKLLPNIKAETLILHGRKDLFVQLFQAEYLHKNIKNSKLEIWDDGRHNLHLRYPERFNELLEDFFTFSSKI